MVAVVALPVLIVVLKAVCVAGIPADDAGMMAGMSVTEAVKEAVGGIVKDNLKRTSPHPFREDATTTEFPFTEQPNTITTDGSSNSRENATTLLPPHVLGPLLMEATEKTLEQLVWAQDRGQIDINADVIHHLPESVWTLLHIPMIQFFTEDFWNWQVTQEFFLDLKHGLGKLKIELEAVSYAAPEAEITARHSTSLDLMSYAFGTSENALRIVNTVLYYIQTLIW